MFPRALPWANSFCPYRANGEMGLHDGQHEQMNMVTFAPWKGNEIIAQGNALGYEWNQQNRPVRAKDLHHTRYYVDDVRGGSVVSCMTDNMNNMVTFAPWKGNEILAQGNALGYEWNQQQRPVRAKELHHTRYYVDDTRGGSVVRRIYHIPTLTPRALPWANRGCPYRANTRLISTVFPPISRILHFSSQ